MWRVPKELWIFLIKLALICGRRCIRACFVIWMLILIPSVPLSSSLRKPFLDMQQTPCLESTILWLNSVSGLLDAKTCLVEKCGCDLVTVNLFGYEFFDH